LQTGKKGQIERFGAERCGVHRKTLNNRRYCYGQLARRQKKVLNEFGLI